MTEHWKPVPGYDGYDVSDRGRVRSYYAYNGKGHGWDVVDAPQRILSPSPDPQGYPGVSLCADGDKRRFRIASLVMLAFVGPRPDGLEVCHRDNNPGHNHIGNLRYDTHKGNYDDMPDETRYARGSPLLTDEQAVEIRRRYAAGGVTHDELGADHGVSATTICHLCRGMSYPHLGGPRTERRLSTGQVEEIRERYAGGGVTQRSLATEHGIHHTTISRMVRGKSYARLPGPRSFAYSTCQMDLKRIVRHVISTVSEEG